MRPLRTGGQHRDNRKHERVHSHVRCWCEGENVTLYSRVGNLSEGGLFLRTSTPLATGSKATLRLELAPSHTVEAQARVVWSRGSGGVGPAGMGLEFQQQASLGEIHQLIARELAAKHAKG